MLKKKNIYVIFVTVFIVFLIILSSFLGFITYLQWRQLNFVAEHYKTLERIDTAVYAKNIRVDSLEIKPGFKGLPILEGRISNGGKREVVSLTLKVNFLDSLGKPVYSCIVYPLEPFRPPKFFKKIQLMRFVFLKDALMHPRGALHPKKTVRFKSALWLCPKTIVQALKKKRFSNTPGEWCGKVDAESVRVRLKPT